MNTIVHLINDIETLNDIRETVEHDPELRQYMRWLCSTAYAAPINALIDSTVLERFFAEMLWLASIGALQPMQLSEDDQTTVRQFGNLLLDLLKHLSKVDCANVTELYLNVAVSLFRSVDEFQLYLDGAVRRGIFEYEQNRYRLVPSYEIARRQTLR